MEQLSLLCYTIAISTVKHFDILMESILILILDESDIHLPGLTIFSLSMFIAKPCGLKFSWKKDLDPQFSKSITNSFLRAENVT